MKELSTLVNADISLPPGPTIDMAWVPVNGVVPLLVVYYLRRRYGPTRGTWYFNYGYLGSYYDISRSSYCVRAVRAGQ